MTTRQPLLCDVFALGVLGALAAGCRASHKEAHAVFLCGQQTCNASDLEMSLVELAESQRPTDVAFNPAVGAQLWITTASDDDGSGDGLVVLDTSKLDDPGMTPIVLAARKGLSRPLALAFGPDDRLITCGEERDLEARTGPTLWLPEPALFQDEDDVDAAVMDRIEESTWCSGAVAERAGVYWVFDGCGGHLIDGTCDENADLVRYEFGSPDGPVPSNSTTDGADADGSGSDSDSEGDTDDSGADAREVDGRVRRYRGLVARQGAEHVGLALEPKSGHLYVADPGRQRVLRIDPSFGRRAEDLDSTQVGVEHSFGEGFHCDSGDEARGCWVVADHDSAQLERPSGVVLWNGMLYVSDVETGRVAAVSIAEEPPDEPLKPISSVDLGYGRLAGMALGPESTLWIAAPSKGIVSLKSRVSVERIEDD